MRGVTAALMVAVIFMVGLPRLHAAEDIPSAVARGRQALLELVTRRDELVARLNQRLATDAADGVLFDLALEATHMFRHRPLEFELYIRGDRVYGGHGHLTSWNHGLHEIDASGLSYRDGRLSGTMRVTLNPDQWVPSDHRPRHQVHRIAATVTDDTVHGTYRYTGALGPDKDALVGTVTPVQDGVEIAAPSGDQPVVGDVTGLKTLTTRATTAYRQLRAAALALRNYPMSYERALKANRVAMPFWQTDDAQAVAEMGDYLVRLTRQAAAYRPELMGDEGCVVGFVHPDDPRFGPFFKNGPLPVAEGVPYLPAETGSRGPQRWQYIQTWEVTGPFPAPYRSDDLEPQLPEWIPAGAACYRLRTEDFPDGRFLHPDWLGKAERRMAYDAYQADNWFKTYERPAEAVTYAVERSVKSGRWQDSVCPPRWASIQTKIPVWAARRVFYFGTAQLRAPRDMEVWCEAAQEDAGQLWVNGRMVWHSAKDLDDLKIPKYAIFKVPLRAGENEIVYRVRNDDTQSKFRLLFCTRGRPRERDAAGGTASGAVYSNMRGNGTGSYPAPAGGGRPPLAWDVQKGTNVRWRRKLPSFSNAYPVLVGDKVFTNCEPHTLYCFDKLTGEELWRRESSLAEYVKDEERAAVEEALAMIGSRFERSDESPELEKLEQERMAIERKLQAEADELDDEKRAALARRSHKLGQRIDELSGSGERGRRILGSYGAGTGGWWDWCGYTMPTPVTDGERIWVKYNTGVAACYDLDGDRQWMTHTRLTGFIPGVSSPVLIGDRLIIEGGWRTWAKRDGLSREDINERTGALGRQDLHAVLCLDANSGEILWHNYVKCGIGGYGSPSGPRAMRLQLPAGEHLDVIVTQRSVLRVADGQVLHRSTGTSPGYAGFTLGNILFDGPSQSLFWAENPDQIGVRHLVRTTLGGSGYGVAMSGAFLVGNPDPNLKAGRTHVPWQDLVILRRHNGERVYRIHPLMGKTGSAYVPPATCGEYAYLVDGKPGARDNLDAKAVVTVVKVAEEPLVMARSELDGPTYTSPIFDAEGRAYIRTRRSLFCLEATPAGDKLEWDKAVAELFAVQSRLPILPRIEEIPTVVPADGYEPAAEVPVCKVYERLGPPEWLVAGPIPPTTKDDPLADLGGAAKARPEPGSKTDGLVFAPLADEFIEASQGMSKDLYRREHYRSSVKIDLSGHSQGKGGTYYFYTVLEVTRPRTLEYSNQQPKITTWLSGTEIGNDQKCNVTPGLYPLLIRIEVPRLPPFMKGRKLWMTPQFTDVPSTDQRLAELRERVRPYRSRLERVVETVRGKRALEARRYLRLFEPDGAEKVQATRP